MVLPRDPRDVGGVGALGMGLLYKPLGDSNMHLRTTGWLHSVVKASSSGLKLMLLMNDVIGFCQVTWPKAIKGPL